ncbi:MAG: GNAT family N-acetyltransferase [Deltaproteobacteria bacterium]|nr:MAG: GNAT family N-acetyltransferase [Deltaproteobacteria bacterium]TNF25103.1 MAG: GNAT family N-acetyltransferase [Deltaproteobacteria bacterium]
MSAIVRKARHGDEEGIHNSHMTSIQEVCSKDYTPEQIAAWGGRSFNLDQKRNLIDNHHVWVVESDGKVEGYGLLFVSESQFEIGGLYFTPKVLGLGLGKKIIDEMKVVAKSLGAKEIFLSSTKTSKKFYEKQGFHQYDEDDVSMIGGVPVEGHPMKISV